MSRNSSGSGEPVKVLTIAGSDSGGAAGLQADLKTFTALGAYGMSVVTVVTAQNSEEVRAVMPVAADLVDSQLSAVLSDYGAQAVKTGFIGQAEIVGLVAGRLATYRPATLVVDPVLVNYRGESMFPAAVTDAYRDSLLPLATLVTPNPEEAALLSGQVVSGIDDLTAAAGSILALGPAYVLAKGFRDGDEMVDVLVGAGASRIYRRPVIYRRPAIDTQNTHGSGDTLSAAICVYLAEGQEMETAVEGGLHYTTEAIRRAAGWRLGRGHGPVGHF